MYEEWLQRVQPNSQECCSWFAPCKEEFSVPFQSLTSVAHCGGLAWARGKALSSDEVCLVRAARDVHYLELELCNCIQPARLVMADRVLLLEPWRLVLSV